jgi:peptide/nickel transport system permease protein
MAVDPAASPPASSDALEAQVASEPPERRTAGIGPYRLALRRLRHNYTALFFLGVFAIILILCLLAPVYSQDIAHIGPNANNVTGTIREGGKLRDIVSPVGVPIGPSWNLHHYFLGADNNGRDVAVRLLYGGRTSLEIGAIAAALTVVLGSLIGVLAGFLRGVADGVLSWVMNLIWSFPPVLLGVAVGTALAIGGIGPIKGNSLYIPAFIVGLIYIPYLGRPIRAEVLRLREMDFVDAARAQGAGAWRIMASEILPNLVSTIIVYIPLLMAVDIILAAYLAFLGAGVQPPNASWGTLISDGLPLIQGGKAVHLTLAPGIMLIVAVLSINTFGDGLRDALDPRAQVRVRRPRRRRRPRTRKQAGR